METMSVSSKELKFEGDTCNFPDNPSEQSVNVNSDTQLYFTYSVQWKRSEVSWASRWDIYLGMNDVQIHWFSIINSLVVVFFLSGILTMIMIRTLRRDIAKYNTDDNFEETLEETGWKLVHGDVFRPPVHSRFFAAVIGSGIQVFFMALITICKRSYLKLWLIFQILYLNSSFRYAGNVVSVISWSSHDLRDLSICVYGYYCGILLSSSIQNHKRKGMAKGSVFDSDFIPWFSHGNRFVLEFFHVEQTFE